MPRPPELLRYGLLSLPALFVGFFLLVPAGLTFVISFWERKGFSLHPALSFAAYQAFFSGVRLEVLQISLQLAVIVTLLGLLLAYPVSYFLAYRVGARTSRTWLFLLSVPFVINPVIRNFALAYILGRTGPVNQMVLALGLTGRPIDWLLFSNFAVVLGLVLSYMPFMIYPLWLSLAGIDRRLVEASWMLGVPPGQTFRKVTLPLSLPGIFAAAIFGFVGTFSESTVPIILGGLGYQLMGNTITSALDVLNYPLAAAMSSVVTISMLVLLLLWYQLFDIRSFMGKIVQT
jgi:ABC-type spermidine/putrescine transport system permease subunit I